MGEIGTEKELLAELIHEKNKGSKSPLIKLSLSQKMSSNEIKKLLFGQERGASTVELAAQSGLLEQAKGGSIFIDNLESLPEETLKVLASKHFSRLGSSILSPIEVQLIGGGSPSLAKKKKPVFDFFSEVLIEVPALRDRTSDLPTLVNHFFEKYSDQYGRELKITAPVLEALISYPWPGNTKQLEALIERIFLACPSSEIKPEDLPIDILLKTAGNIGGSFVASFEKKYIKKTCF